MKIKENKKMFILLIVVVLIMGITAVIIKIVKENKASKEELNMVQEYLSEKYNMNLEIEDYSYIDNGDLGFYAGEHYNFYFKSIDGLKIDARLDYLGLHDNNALSYIILNITDIAGATDLKNYI